MDAVNISSNISGQIYLDPGVNVWGLIITILLYLVVLIIGIYASRKNKSNNTANTENIMLAGRNLGFFVGVCTMSATWVGGGSLSAAAEVVFMPGGGLANCTLPFSYGVSLILLGIFFAGKMRQRGYVTMLDPFVEKYGKVMAGILYIPCLLGDVCWIGLVLATLGATLAVILGISRIPSILITAGVAIIYTAAGGLYSVIFTDVIQIVFMIIGLWFGFGFAINNPAVSPITETAVGPNGWLGKMPNDVSTGPYIENVLLVCLGGIPWQASIQRVLASRTVQIARFVAILGGLGCIVLVIPAVLIGAVASSADWNNTDYHLYRPVPVPPEDYTLALPLVLQYLTPGPIAVLGMAALSAAVMSSADSSLMSASSMFTHNIYSPLLQAITKKTVSQRQKMLVMRISVICVGALATAIALTSFSFYYLGLISSDLVYVAAFPELVCVVHFSSSNTYGAVAGFVIALLLRILGGEPSIGLPPLLKYPYYDHINGVQYFPFKTLSMLVSLVTIMCISYFTKFLFENRYLSSEWDVFHCFKQKNEQLEMNAVDKRESVGLMKHTDICT